MACKVIALLREINGRWIASADTPDGPSLGLGKGAVEAVEHALEPFGAIVEELLASLPKGRAQLAGHPFVRATHRRECRSQALRASRCA